VTIFDDELIVGRPNTWLGRYTLVYPELDGSIMIQGADTFLAAEYADKPDAVHVTADDKKIIDEVFTVHRRIRIPDLRTATGSG
jgi:hypothetical protein